MSTNLSKQKREDLLNKIKEIRAFISAAPQDENTGNLLSYLSDLEKDVKRNIARLQMCLSFQCCNLEKPHSVFGEAASTTECLP